MSPVGLQGCFNVGPASETVGQHLGNCIVFARVNLMHILFILLRRIFMFLVNFISLLPVINHHMFFDNVQYCRVWRVILTWSWQWETVTKARWHWNTPTTLWGIPYEKQCSPWTWTVIKWSITGSTGPTSPFISAKDSRTEVLLFWSLIILASPCACGLWVWPLRDTAASGVYENP